MNLHLQKRETRPDIFRSKFSTKLFSGKEVSVTINSVVCGTSCQVSLWNGHLHSLMVSVLLCLRCWLFYQLGQREKSHQTLVLPFGCRCRICLVGLFSSRDGKIRDMFLATTDVCYVWDACTSLHGVFLEHMEIVYIVHLRSSSFTDMLLVVAA